MFVISIRTVIHDEGKLAEKCRRREKKKRTEEAKEAHFKISTYRSHGRGIHEKSVIKNQNCRDNDVDGLFNIFTRGACHIFHVILFRNDGDIVFSQHISARSRK